MKIITAGSAYIDIDAYAGIIAYAELLEKQGIAAKAVSTAPLNESIPKTVRSWPATLATSYTASAGDTYTIIDISTPEYFDSFVDIDHIETVIDHHPGFETYWQERIGKGMNIEQIGAACTQVYECWKSARLLDKISTTSARLLVCGILDNTLNFGAKICTQRDIDAYKDLMSRAKLPADWPAQYFEECQAAINENPVAAMQKDTKTVQFVSRKEPVRVGQFAVWDATEIPKNYQDGLTEAFIQQTHDWFMNIISIGDKKSYFICSNPEMQQWLSKLLNITFKDSLAVAPIAIPNQNDVSTGILNE